MFDEFKGINSAASCSKAMKHENDESSLPPFLQSDSHYLKKVMVHPERDMENMVRVID